MCYRRLSVNGKTGLTKTYLELGPSANTSLSYAKNLRTASAHPARKQRVKQFRSTGFSKRSAEKMDYIMTLEEEIERERKRRGAMESLISTPKCGKRIFKGALQTPTLKSTLVGKRTLAEEVTVQLNLQNLRLRGNSFQTKFTLPGAIP